MGAAIAHRGPDDASRFIENDVALAFRRLSIIDVAGGQQPIWNEQNTCAILLNGEIFLRVEPDGTPPAARFHARLTLPSGGWLAASCVGQSSSPRAGAG